MILRLSDQSRLWSIFLMAYQDFKETQDFRVYITLSGAFDSTVSHGMEAADRSTSDIFNY